MTDTTSYNTVKVVVIDDHELFRIGLRSVLSKKDKKNRVEIIFEASTGQELFSFLELGNLPDIILLDIVLPDMSGIEISRCLKSKFKDIKIIMLSSESSEELLFELLDIEVEGYVSKSDLTFEILHAIDSVCEGENYYGKTVSKILFDLYKTGQLIQSENKFSLPSKEGKVVNADLSEREIDVIKLWCDGATAKEISTTLDISSRTVESHKENILNKLGFEKFTDLIKYAIKNGIITI
ncbi:MAG: response regulator transcription factor [Salinivirgaceae bacterium]|nr:response regulator transcription factor [Bacteroidales bacterium]